MNRRDCLKAIAAWVPIVIAQPAVAKEETLTGYLTSTGRDASFAARKLLWTDFRPAEKYTGSALQNIDFLTAIKAFDAAPRIELIKAKADPHEEVKVKITYAGVLPIGIESGLNLQSMSVQPGGVASLGKATDAGSYSIRVFDGKIDHRYLLFVLPTTVGFSVELYGATAKSLPPNSPMLYQPDADVADALAKLFASLTEASIEMALQGSIPMWLAENAGSLGETAIVCAVGGPVPCLFSGAANGWSVISAVLTKLASESMVLNDEEKQLLKKVFAIGDAAGQLAASFRGIPQRKRLCELAQLGIVLTDSVAGQIDNAGARVSIKVMLQSTKKYTVLLCAKNL